MKRFLTYLLTSALIISTIFSNGMIVKAENALPKSISVDDYWDIINESTYVSGNSIVQGETSFQNPDCDPDYPEVIKSQVTIQGPSIVPVGKVAKIQYNLTSLEDEIYLVDPYRPFSYAFGFASMRDGDDSYQYLASSYWEDIFPIEFPFDSTLLPSTESTYYVYPEENSYDTRSAEFYYYISDNEPVLVRPFHWSLNDPQEFNKTSNDGEDYKYELNFPTVGGLLINGYENEITVAADSDEDNAITKEVADESFDLGVSLSNNDAPISYSSSNEEVATVNSNGIVNILSEGDTDITIQAEQNGFYKENSKTISLSVIKSDDSGNNNGKDDSDDGDKDNKDDNKNPNVENKDPQVSQKPSGNDNDKKEPATVKPDQPSAPLEKGTAFTSKSGKYTVTSANAKNPTVAYAPKANSKTKSITVPDTVKYNGITYTVTSIKNNAFKGCTALKTVTIKSKKLSSIGSNAFKNCKNLRTINLQSTVLKKIGKNAFKGVHKKCTLKVKKAKYSAYNNLVKRSGNSKYIKLKK